MLGPAGLVTHLFYFIIKYISKKISRFPISNQKNYSNAFSNFLILLNCDTWWIFFKFFLIFLKLKKKNPASLNKILYVIAFNEEQEVRIEEDYGLESKNFLFDVGGLENARFGHLLQEHSELFDDISDVLTHKADSGFHLFDYKS